jgi:hypothetical protein
MKGVIFMEYLCHYTKEETAKLIIENMTLKFGKICESNDPIEVKDFDVFLPGKNIDEEIALEKGIRIKLKSYLDQILQLICFSKGDIRNIEGDVNDDGEEVDIEDDVINNANIENFSKRPPYYLPRMWAQYGNNHKGVCLIFNSDELVDQVKSQSQSLYYFKHKEIMYADFLNNDDILLKQAVSQVYSFDAHKDPMEFIQKYLKNNKYLNYFVKDIDWKDEREYRFLLWNKIENNDYDNKIIHINNKSLIGVVLGLCNNSTQLVKLSSEQKIKNTLKLKYMGSLIGLQKIKY